MATLELKPLKVLLETLKLAIALALIEAKAPMELVLKPVNEQPEIELIVPLGEPYCSMAAASLSAGV